MLDIFFALTEKVALAVTGFITALGYWGIALGMAVESANIPLPSEIILPFGGYLVATGQLNFVGAAMAGTIGGTVGSVISYWFGLSGGRPFLLRYGKYVGISWRHFQIAEDYFLRYGEITVFVTRLLPVVRTFISFPAGIARMHFGRFVLYTFLGSLPWCFFLTYLGLKMGEHWTELEFWFHRFDLVLIILAGLTLLLLAFFHKR